MLRRFITSILLLVFGLPGLIFGGPLYFLVADFFLLFAAWEYVEISRASGWRASRPLVVGGVLAITAARAFSPADSVPVFTILVLLAMAIHLIEYERGRDQAALDFYASLGGLAYIGWVGAYLLDLRLHSGPDGGWWIMLVLPVVWLVDTGAYSIGARYGVHKMAPRLSPGKSWEGFWAGAFSGMLGGAFFAFAYSPWGPVYLPGLGWPLQGWGPLHLPIWQGALFGLVIGLLTPLGDLGESMIKRQAGMKDSGNLFPGHGGAFDRIDSWMWAAVLGYYFITRFVH
jgi:phosphatidate cytidylyltransferase